MKINEILTEGPIWSGVKQVGTGLGNIAKGAATGAGKIAGNVAKAGINTAGWMGYEPAAQASRALKQAGILGKQQQAQATAQAEQEKDLKLIQILKDRAGNRGGTISMSEIGSLIPKTITDINQRRSKVNQIAGVLAQQGINVTGGAQARPTAAATAEPTPPTPTLHPEVTVVNSSPIVLRYRNTDFALGADNRWTRFPGSKAVDPTTTAFLNKQLQAL